jgi:hypothetical protein
VRKSWYNELKIIKNGATAPKTAAKLRNFIFRREKGESL